MAVRLTCRHCGEGVPGCPEPNEVHVPEQPTYQLGLRVELVPAGLELVPTPRGPAWPEHLFEPVRVDRRRRGEV